MWLYEETYGLTRLRLLVSTVELWLGAVFLLIAAAGVRLRARWLPRTVLGAGVVALLALAAVNPDARIAEHNVARYDRTGVIDLDYLANLSVDALPELERLPAKERYCSLRWMAGDLAADEPWYQYNAARDRARDILAARPLDARFVCEAR
jgi:hypothetical protein